LPRSTSTPSVMTPELSRIATVVVLGSIMSILDTTIVAVALATLGRDFRVSVSTIQWVTTGYLLALAMVIPVTGWAVDRFGHKRIFMLSLTVFLIGSSLCGLAWSANSLIAFRVLQGLGGGMILPVGQSMLARAAGPQRMGRVMSVIGAPTVLGPILGPVLGGLIVSNFSWRWIFYINVPVGIVTLVLSSRFLKGDEEKVNRSFDLRGFALLSPGLAALVYSLSEVGITGKFTSAPVLVSFVLGVALTGGFVVHALRARHPLLDLRLFRNRNFTIANISIFILGATLYGSMFILPLYYQIARGESPWQAGLLMAPQGIGAALVMRKSGAITDRLGPRRVVPPGILHGGGHRPLRLRHVHQRSIPVGRHLVPSGPGARAVHDADHGRGLLRPLACRCAQRHDHPEHRAPDRGLDRHCALRCRFATSDRREHARPLQQ
jgi:EmrB/QacA subfamily drug resistance transporter